jgi:hypothetical protein
MTAKRRVQPGDRHLERGSFIRFTTEQRRDARVRAANETVELGRNVTFSDVIRKALEEYLSRHGRKA